MTSSQTQGLSSAIARFRADAGVTQTVLAEYAGLDQSRVSRIEKGEPASVSEVDRLLQALARLGVKKANDYKPYATREWLHIEQPSFWNPELACLEITEETLGKIEDFLKDEDRPWPLRRQIERHRESLIRSATFLIRQNHNLAFVGDMGVGRKSTAISFIFDLLVPVSMAEKSINRPILETGAGGTTICEVHVKGGPEFGITLQPMSDSEMSQLVADFCAAKWAIVMGEQRDNSDTVGVSREVERAIRNMSGLSRRRETVNVAK